MAKFTITIRDVIEAYSAETAAREAVRVLQTGRPVTVDVTPPGGKPVFIRVEAGGETKRIA